MPAILNEAFSSPLDNTQGQPKGEDSGTSDIRNPLYRNTNTNSGSGITNNSYQQNYHDAPLSQSMNSIYSQVPMQMNQESQSPHYYQAPTTHYAPIQYQLPDQHQLHKCDQLIADIMSCRICRQKLQGLLTNYHEDHPKTEKIQSGGSGGNILNDIMDSNSNLIVNIAIGIALLFLLDKILKLRA